MMKECDYICLFTRNEISYVLQSIVLQVWFAKMNSSVNIPWYFISCLYCSLTSLFPYTCHHIIIQNIQPSSIDSIIVIMSFWRLRSSFSKSTWLECFDSLSCIWENRNKKPPTASHNLQTQKVHKQKCRVQMVFHEHFLLYHLLILLVSLLLLLLLFLLLLLLLLLLLPLFTSIITIAWEVQHKLALGQLPQTYFVWLPTICSTEHVFIKFQWY